ncbi:isoflavone reductase [Diaporthe amygdali]|uniref:isoflavone reductase n=1 Tax=Phomopsis amygdali TaxID=1214568 RepID=UPI0022FDFAC5|nr:isoflavone reductase [Diaporthe amygdali]KAJ0117466.1 isoflavone reductase [Diaporthe amygdali]
MSSEGIKVAIFGAAGESAGRILSGLLESKTPIYKVTALARSASSSKPVYTELAAQGVNVVAVDLNGPEAELVSALQGQDVIIASVPPNALESQLPLIRAAKLANVKRFIPSAFAMAITPNGVSTVQKEKEEIYAELAASGLSYTIIDNLVPGDGEMKTYVVDNEDVGNFVARIIADPRTINKRVMAAGASLSFNEMFGIAEELTGEKALRKYASADELKSMIDDISSKSQNDPSNYFLLVGKFWLEYYYSSFIDGDNSPEGAKRLGYILATDLYPDMNPRCFKDFFKDILAKRRRLPYSDRF